MSAVLNRSTAKSIIRMFDTCFRQGVLDAAQLDDSYETRDFIITHKKSWGFGTLGDREDIDWREFRFTLYRWGRLNGLARFVEIHALQIKKKDYLWCLLPYCMRFYLLGLQEWVSYPNHSCLSIFKMSSRVHWDKSISVKKFTRMEYVSYMHEFASEYRRIAEEEQFVPASVMDAYCMAIYELTGKKL